MTLAEFDTIAQGIPYQPKGVFYSEMCLFLLACEQAGVNCIMESGVKYGMSTRLLAAAFDGPIYSIDRSVHGEPPSKITFIRGDAWTILPQLLAAHANQRVGILIDGPKNDEATRLKDHCWMFPCVHVAAIHGTVDGMGESTHSWDASWQEQTRALDRGIAPDVRALYPNGPGLAVWVKACA